MFSVCEYVIGSVNIYMEVVNPLVRQLERLEERPIMMINHDERYIILYDTEENIQKFKNCTKDSNQEFLDQFKYYSNKDELIEYLLSERYTAVSDLLCEVSMDMGLDEAILNAEPEELKRLEDKYLAALTLYAFVKLNMADR